MSTIYTDPPQSRNEAIIKSTIDGTQYTDPPQSRMEDLLLDLKEVIEGGGGGGTTVVANPEGEATDELEKLQVGSNIYEIPKDYEEMSNKPSINSVELSGNKTASDLGLQTELKGAQTVEGNPITITDAESMNAESVVVELEPKQDLHGYDAPWVGGAGKNKFIGGNGGSQNGVTITKNSDGSYSFNGTSTEHVVFTIADEYYLPNGSYILSGGIPDIHIGFSYGSERVDNIGGDTNFSISDGKISWVQFVILTGVNTTGKTIYPMVRLATETDPTFAPYSNICPITGYSEVNLERVGKNLFDESEVVQGSKTEPSNGTRCCTRGYFGLYLHAGDVVTYSSNSYDVNCSFEIIDEDYNSYQDSGWITENTTITITTSGYAFFGFKKANNSNIQPSDIQALNIQLELGNQATTFAPYQGSTTTIDLDGTKYGGTLDVTSGVLTVDRAEVEYDGSVDESWRKFGSGSASAFAMTESTIIANINQDATPISNELQGVNRHDTWGNYHDFVSISASYGSERGQIACGIDTITTVEDWVTFLSNNPLQVCYKLATPLTIQLTPTQIQMLENTNNISTNATNIQLKYQPNNVIGECKQYTDEKCSEVLPPLPTTDGTYHLSCEVTSGVGVLSWVSDS